LLRLTQLASADRGTTLEYLNTQYLSAETVISAEQYEFRITNGAYAATATDVLQVGKIRLLQFAGYQYGLTYQVAVRAKVAGATQYEFLVENSGLSYSQSIVSNTFTFNFAQLTGLQTNTSYNVSVRTKVSGIWSPYGTPCSIRTFGVTPLLARNAKQQSVPVAKTGLAEKENDVNTLKITNLITPNGDGKNDFWIVEKIDQFPNNSVRIFNKAGRVIFTMKGYDNSWNATVNGTPIDEGTYYYLIDFGKNKLSKKGYITVVREETK